MPRHRLLALLSLFVHAVALAAIFVAQLFAVGTLPMPRRPLTYSVPRVVHLADISLPPTPHQIPARRRIERARDDISTERGADRRAGRRGAGNRPRTPGERRVAPVAHRRRRRQFRNARPR